MAAELGLSAEVAGEVEAGSGGWCCPRWTSSSEGDALDLAPQG